MSILSKMKVLGVYVVLLTLMDAIISTIGVAGGHSTEANSFINTVAGWVGYPFSFLIYFISISLVVWAMIRASSKVGDVAGYKWIMYFVVFVFAFRIVLLLWAIIGWSFIMGWLK